MHRRDEPALRTDPSPILRPKAPPEPAPDGLAATATATTPEAVLPLDFDPPRERMVRAGRRNLHEKLMAGLVGIKHAVRGDSSFFAHAYRALLIFLTAGMIGVSWLGWLLLILSLGLVLVAELMHSAVDTLARAVGDPEEPRLKVARDVAASGVLVTVFTSGAVSIAVLALKLGEYLGWWERVAW